MNGSTEALYDDYIEFQSWGEQAIGREDEYREIIRTLGAVAPGRILELGFGQGGMLEALKRAGFETFGTERIALLVDAANTRGHRAFLTEGPPPPLTQGSFDGVVALDVLEHLDFQQLREMMAWVANLLRPGGRLLVRVPNGGSPLGRLYQHGDLTHKIQLNGESLRQICIGLPLKIVSVQNSRLYSRLSPKGLVRRLKYLLRDMIEIIVCNLYYGYRTPLDPNLVVVMRKDTAGPSGE